MRRLSLVLLVALPTLAAAQDRKPLPPAEAKAAFRKLLDRPRVKLDPKVEDHTRKGELLYDRWSFASDTKFDGRPERVPVLIVRHRDAKGKLPVVIVLHGTGGNKEGVASWLEEFAKQGMLAVAIDARYHGDRVPGVKGAVAYNDAIIRAWRTPAGQPMEHPFYYDTVWDLWRLLDFVQALELADPTRIAMLGISMGGIQTWLAAAADDRVTVVLPLIAVQSFRWSLDNDQWQGRANSIKTAHEAAAKDLGEPMVNKRVCRELWTKVIPGILDDFDCPNMLRMTAPRPLFIANGAKDPNCPIEGAKLAFAAAEEAYAKAGARDKLDVRVADVAHEVTPEHHAAAVAFCGKWLK